VTAGNFLDAAVVLGGFVFSPSPVSARSMPLTRDDRLCAKSKTSFGKSAK
jgi:hypothetical protein